MQRRMLGLILGMVFLVWSLPASATSKVAQPEHLKLYLGQIIHQDDVRNYKNLRELNRVSGWLKEQMYRFGIPCSFQSYVVNSLSYRNLICKIDTKAKDTTVITAHYDVYTEQQGANNNASGVVGVLETARILKRHQNKLKTNVEFAFTVLDEPPYQGTEHMGSYQYAKLLKAQQQTVNAVYVLDSIGHYDENLIQTYPVGVKWFYPRHANFIASIGDLRSSGLTETFCDNMKQLSCERFVAPAFAQRDDISGYLVFSQFKFPTVLITDTAQYRNPDYNTARDTVAQLDLTKMSAVVNGLVHAVLAE